MKDIAAAVVMYGLEMRSSLLLIDEVAIPPHNRREARRRVVVARRRVQRGVPVPRYMTTRPSERVLIISNVLYAHPITLGRILKAIQEINAQ